MSGGASVSPTLAMMSATTQQQETARHQRRKGKGKGQGKSKHADTLTEVDDRSVLANASVHYPWWPADVDGDMESAFITQPLGDEVGILPDTGAHDNLCGDKWARRL